MYLAIIFEELKNILCVHVNLVHVHANKSYMQKNTGGGN